MTSSSTSECDRERVAEYVLGAMPAGERAAFAAHVAECPACRDELASFRRVLETFVDWPADVLRPPAELWDRLADRIGALPATEPLAIREPDWDEVGPGIWCKLLATDAASGIASMLVRLEPGAAYPPHTHAGREELHLLDGELWIDDRKLHAGDYNRAEPGSADQRVWTETGCTCVLVTSHHDVLV